MQAIVDSSEQAIKAGMEAFRQGRISEARALFESAAEAGSSSGVLWMLLAVCRRRDNDLEAEEAALNRLLEIEPESVRGHVMKGDCRAAVGDERSAIYFYGRALRLAKGRQLPAEVLDDVRQAEQKLSQLKRSAHEQREFRLTARGLPPESWSPRLRRSLEVAAGQRQLYYQQPTTFSYVELPHVQFFDPSEFEWAPGIEAATRAIREELSGLLEKRGDKDFRAYIQGETIRMDANRDLMKNKDWSALFLCENSQVMMETVQRCPRTWQAVQKAPLPSIATWGPTVMFSLLKAGARIRPHTGMFNTRLVCHLPLIVPPNCRFRVGNEIREWEVGKLMIFDDTIEHEAWNDSSEDRVILIFDIWRPELTDQERYELTMLLAN